MSPPLQPRRARPPPAPPADPLLAAAASLAASVADPSKGPPQIVPDLSAAPASVQRGGEAVQRQVSRAWYVVAGVPFGFAALGLLFMLLRSPLVLELITAQLRGLGLTAPRAPGPCEP